jgi:protein-tyrosine-phosphatase
MGYASDSLKNHVSRTDFILAMDENAKALVTLLVDRHHQRHCFGLLHLTNYPVNPDWTQIFIQVGYTQRWGLQLQDCSCTPTI